jgi:hypothetical protein
MNMGELVVPHGGLFTTALPCQLHVVHRPLSHINHMHHVWPLAEGGPDVPGNRIVACPTGHYNVHELLRLHKRYGSPRLHPGLTAGFARTERACAELGWRRITQRAI